MEIAVAAVSVVIIASFLAVIGYARSQLLKIAAILDELPSSVIVADARGQIVSLNRRAAQLLGNAAPGRLLSSCPLGEALGKGSGSRTIVHSMNNVERELRVDERLVTRPDGNIDGRIYLITDITGARRSDEEERRSDRLAAAGSLAAGIAHEVKNPLSSLAVNIQLLEENIVASPNPAKVRHYLSVIQSEVKRLNAIVDNFIDFSRPNVMQPAPASLEEILHSIFTLVTPECDRQKVAVVKTPVVGASSNVLIDASQITRALLNIVINAIQSMPMGGTLTWGVEYVEDYAVVRVSDTGGGIKPDDMNKIFDLFYSTKKGGTGLGLSLAQKIVAGHKGYINVKNTGGGACFTVGIPFQGAGQPWASTTNTGS